jgi:hypothetical protein
LSTLGIIPVDNGVLVVDPLFDIRHGFDVGRIEEKIPDGRVIDGTGDVEGRHGDTTHGYYA